MIKINKKEAKDKFQHLYNFMLMKKKQTGCLQDIRQHKILVNQINLISNQNSNCTGLIFLLLHQGLFVCPFHICLVTFTENDTILLSF